MTSTSPAGAGRSRSLVDTPPSSNAEPPKKMDIDEIYGSIGME